MVIFVKFLKFYRSFTPPLCFFCISAFFCIFFLKYYFMLFFLHFCLFLYEFLGLKCKKIHKGYKSEKNPNKCAFFFFHFCPFLAWIFKLKCIFCFFFAWILKSNVHFLLFFLHFGAKKSMWGVFVYTIFRILGIF